MASERKRELRDAIICARAEARMLPGPEEREDARARKRAAAREILRLRRGHACDATDMIPWGFA